ncbi:hypothetical protein ACLESO_49895 [Pyxidicoccus sp. 3LG]
MLTPLSRARPMGKLLDWLGYTREAVPALYGNLPARDLAARCLRRLWPESRNADAAVSTIVEDEPGHAPAISVVTGHGEDPRSRGGIGRCRSLWRSSVHEWGRPACAEACRPP